jgi:hypothetical protein
MDWVVTLIGFIAVVLLLSPFFKKKQEDHSSENELNFHIEVEEQSTSKFVPWTEKDLLWQGKRKLQIAYKDRHGDVTERNIEIYGIWPEQTGEIYYRAFCLLRNDWRTFKADNTVHVITARKKKFNNFFDYMRDELAI